MYVSVFFVPGFIKQYRALPKASCTKVCKLSSRCAHLDRHGLFEHQRAFSKPTTYCGYLCPPQKGVVPPHIWRSRAAELLVHTCRVLSERDHVGSQHALKAIALRTRCVIRARPRNAPGGIGHCAQRRRHIAASMRAGVCVLMAGGNQTHDGTATTHRRQGGVACLRQSPTRRTWFSMNVQSVGQRSSSAPPD